MPHRSAHILLFFILILTGPLTLAQDSLWTANFGGSFNESGCAAIQLSDGDIVMIGSTYSYGAGDHDIYLIKTDSTGILQWAQTFGGAGTDYGYDLVETSDGGLILVGSTRSFGAGGRDVYLIKTDSGGIEQWSKTYGGTSNDEGFSVREVYDKGFAICGTTASYGTNGDIYLIRTDSLGDSSWTKTYGGSAGEAGAAVRITSDSGFVLVGTTGSYGAGYSSIYLIRTDSIGDTVWTANYGGSRADLGFTVEETTDLGFIIGGATAPTGANFYDAYIIKTDSLGVTAWDSAYGGVYEDRAYSIKETSDGGYIIGGTTEGSGARKIDIYILKIDGGGNTEWDNSYGGPETDKCLSLILDIDDNYLALGTTYSISNGGSDLCLLKISSGGATDIDWTNPFETGLTYELRQNFPNPFNLETRIDYFLPRQTEVMVKIYNILGQTVRVWDQGYQPAGPFTILWDGRNEWGETVASGVYFYRLIASDYTETKKMVLLK